MNVNISFKNAEEFKELLERAATLTKKLEETLQQIQNFEPKTTVFIKSTIKVDLDCTKIFKKTLQNIIEEELNKIHCSSKLELDKTTGLYHPKTEHY